MALLDPHLPHLSHYWLAALLDHAHLALPPEFSRQLPSSGGTFYSNNVAESVKPYFEHNWPSLLHAAAIWLQTTGLKADSSQEEAISVTVQPLMPTPLLSAPGSSLSRSSPLLTDPKRDRFYLVLGLAVQTLCTPATLDAPITLLHCLKALCRLLEAEYALTEIKSDPKLATEILHLLHRLLLTCQSHDLHVIVMQTAVLVGSALQEGAVTDGGSGRRERENMKLEDYERTPMFALLEVSVCCLLRLVPDLNPGDRDSSSAMPSRPNGRVTSEEMTVASHAASLLPMAVSLCTVEETVDALPTVLHILLHTVKFASLNQPLSASLLSSCVRSLQQLTSQLALAHSVHGQTLSLTVRSMLTSLVGGPGTAASQTDVSGDLSQTEGEVKLLVVAVLLRAPSPTVCPPGSHIFEAVVQLFKDSLFSPTEKVTELEIEIVL